MQIIVFSCLRLPRSFHSLAMTVWVEHVIARRATPDEAISYERT